VKADAAQVLQSHLGRVLVFQNVPVAQKLKKPELLVFFKVKKIKIRREGQNVKSEDIVDQNSEKVSKNLT
jgi:hypothetical protein